MKKFWIATALVIAALIVELIKYFCSAQGVYICFWIQTIIVITCIVFLFTNLWHKKVFALVLTGASMVLLIPIISSFVKTTTNFTYVVHGGGGRK